jgi:hypothetical protein
MYPDIFNNPAIAQMMANMGGQQGGTGTFTASGRPYSGPFANDTRTPFRTVEGVGQYGNGLNASAAQMYEHFNGAPAGFKPIEDMSAIQTLDDFKNRGALSQLAGPIQGNYPNGGVPWGDESIVTNSDWLNWMKQQNALSGKDLDWFGRWFQESGTGGNKGWVSGDVRGWDSGGSDLNQENKNRVAAALNYMGNYWDPWEKKKKDVPPPKLPVVSNGGIFNGVDQGMLDLIMKGMK